MALDLELILQSQEPFKHFYDFICDFSKQNLVYIDLYIMIRLYEEKIKEFMRSA
jgi:hypothetical protein